MTQREEFEGWAESNCYILDLDEDGDYENNLTFSAFEAYQAAKAHAVPQWIPLSERLPDEDYGYFLVTRKYWNDGDPHVCYSFYIKDRDMAKREHANGYSRKYQGKDSIHFECSRYGFVITHWMPLPTVPEQQK